eukprot:scaffold114200_cov66-Phaeocystis_antarctica.AAC.1
MQLPWRRRRPARRRRRGTGAERCPSAWLAPPASAASACRARASRTSWSCGRASCAWSSRSRSAVLGAAQISEGLTTGHPRKGLGRVHCAHAHGCHGAMSAPGARWAGSGLPL